MINTLIEALFKDAKLTPEEIQSQISELDNLFSGESYQCFLDSDLSDSSEKELIIENIGICLLIVTIIPDQVIAQMPPELKEKIQVYLDNIYNKFVKIINEARTRFSNTSKDIEDMSREELIDYIKQKFNKH